MEPLYFPMMMEEEGFWKAAEVDCMSASPGRMKRV